MVCIHRAQHICSEERSYPKTVWGRRGVRNRALKPDERRGDRWGDLGSNPTSAKDLQGSLELGITAFHVCEMGIKNTCSEVYVFYSVKCTLSFALPPGFSRCVLKLCEMFSKCLCWTYKIPSTHHLFSVPHLVVKHYPWLIDLIACSLWGLSNLWS